MKLGVEFRPNFGAMSPKTSVETARGLHRLRPPAISQIPQYVLPEYNAVGISELKRNPTRIFALAGEAPVAVFRHNKVIGFMLTARSFNEILEKQVNLQADRSELAQLVHTAAPGLLELLAQEYPDREFSPFVPQWPIFGDIGRRRGRGRTGVVSSERLESAIELATEWINMHRKEAARAAGTQIPACRNCGYQPVDEWTSGPRDLAS